MFGVTKVSPEDFPQTNEDRVVVHGYSFDVFIT